MSSGGKASQILCSKVEVVPSFLDLTFVSGNIPLCVCMLSHFSSATLWTVAPRLFCPCVSPGNNTGVGSSSLLQGIFLPQGSNLQSLMSPPLAGGFFTTNATWEAQYCSKKVLMNSCSEASQSFFSF